jgi:hypothetical protein
MVRALFLVCALCSLANADGKQQAAELAKEGNRHFRLNEFEEALKSYTEAYRNVEEPNLLFNIAQCHRQLNHKSEAVRFLKSYLQEVPEAEGRDEVVRTIQALEAALREEEHAKSLPPQGPLLSTPEPARPEPATSLRVTSEPTGAVVRLETESGPSAGETPFESAIQPGPHKIYVTKGGYKSERRDLEIVQGASANVDVRLNREESPVEPVPIYKKWWLWTAMGAVVVVAVGVGVGVGLSSSPSTPAAPAGLQTIRF